MQKGAVLHIFIPLYNKMVDEFHKITQQNIRLKCCSDSVVKIIIKGNAQLQLIRNQGLTVCPTPAEVEN